MTLTEPGTTVAVQQGLASALADVLNLDEIAADAHFFDDLGADSLVMARFCARIRRRGELPAPSMKEVYRYPTVAALAAALPVRTEPAVPAQVDALAPPPVVASTREYVVCGALQALFIVADACLLASVVSLGYQWVSAGSGLGESYLRLVGYGAASFVLLSALPIAVKWALIGRWQPERIRVWSLAYVRFWVVKTMLRSSPMALFVGSPLYVLYLRALGARIGRRVVIFSQHVPVCTDLLTVGDDTVIRKDSFFTGYRAQAGVIETGPVTLGRDVVVGEATVLDIDTSLGDGAQLGHASSLQRGQTLPAGERRDGFAGQQRTEVDYRGAAPMPDSNLRKAAYVTSQLVTSIAVGLPLLVLAAAWLVTSVPVVSALVDGPIDVFSWSFLGSAAATSLLVSGGGVLGLLGVVLTVPRLLNRALEPGRTYPLYGVHHWAHGVIVRLTNVPFFPRLLGNSSYVVHYLRALGYRFPDLVQTGSNFGLETKHENPFLCTVGSGTMVADGLSMLNTDVSSTSFRLLPTSIGAGSFLGNYITFPPHAKAGDDCLIGTKAMVPLAGERREHTGLLGSPSFPIPRSVRRDGEFDHLATGEEFAWRLSLKNRHNAATIGLYTLGLWLYAFELTVVAALAAALYGALGPVALGLGLVLALVLHVAHFVLLERASIRFGRLRPRRCSIYQPQFWAHERYWKLSWQPLLLDGTPFKSLTWRLLGVRIGKRVFDDGCAIVEKTLVRIGDDCTLGARSIIQSHSQEDGTFKSDRIRIGNRCTLGIGSLVHYGVAMGDDVVLGPDSFQMKGEQAPPGSEWVGNPAHEVRGGGRS